MLCTVEKKSAPACLNHYNDLLDNACCLILFSGDHHFGLHHLSLRDGQVGAGLGWKRLTEGGREGLMEIWPTLKHRVPVWGWGEEGLSRYIWTSEEKDWWRNLNFLRSQALLFLQGIQVFFWPKSNTLGSTIGDNYPSKKAPKINRYVFILRLIWALFTVYKAGICLHIKIMIVWSF